MVDVVRFGRAVQDLPDELDFGAWGQINTLTALNLFQETLDYFDQEDVIRAEAERTAMIHAARRYYDGNHIKPLKVNPGDPDDNVLVNFCRSLVDDSISWLFGNPETGVLKIELSEENQPGPDNEDDPEENETSDREGVGDLLQQVYENSGGFNFFKRLGKRGGISGHFFLKIVLPEKDEMPRVVVLDPQLCSLRTDPADSTRVIAYKVEWRRVEQDPGSRRKDTYIYRQLAVEVNDGAWLVGDFKTKERRKRQWQLIRAGGWPYAWSPVVDGPNIDSGWGIYGLSDLEDVAGLNDSINFLSSNTMRILKHHAHPKTIGTGFGAAEVQDTAIDSFWTIENPDAKVQNLEMQSDLQSSLELLEFLKVAFWTIGRGLDPSVYKDKIGQITNFALRVLAIRAIHKLGDKRLSYGKALRDVNRRLLEVLGQKAEDTVIVWPMPLPEDPEAELRAIETEIELEILSRQTAAEQRGRNWRVEQARIAKWKKENKTLGEFLMNEFDRGGGPFGANNQDGGKQNDEK